jgi:energy-coupling factor transporter ATP-binding protein EcfA2
MGGATIVVADEPTAELDSTSASHVMDTMVELARAGVTFVVATHDRSVMRRADAALELDHGSAVRRRASPPTRPIDRASPRSARRPRRRTRPRRPLAATDRGDATPNPSARSSWTRTRSRRATDAATRSSTRSTT